jgi:hypothetical protein
MGFVHIGGKPHPKNASVVNQDPVVITKTVETERIVEVPVERIVIERVEVPVERNVYLDAPAQEKEIEVRYEQVNLKPLTDKHDELEHKAIKLENKHKLYQHETREQLEAHSRVLVHLRDRRNLDRKRRLQLIQRLKRHAAEQKLTTLKLKLAVGASLLLSLLSLLVK